MITKGTVYLLVGVRKKIPEMEECDTEMAEKKLILVYVGSAINYSQGGQHGRRKMKVEKVNEPKKAAIHRFTQISKAALRAYETKAKEECIKKLILKKGLDIQLLNKRQPHRGCAKCRKSACKKCAKLPRAPGLVKIVRDETVDTLTTLIQEEIDKDKKEMENAIRYRFTKELADKISFPGQGYMRYYDKSNSVNKVLDVRVTKPDAFVIACELEKLNLNIGYE